MGFEPTISAGERLRTYALDRWATGTGEIKLLRITDMLIAGKNNDMRYIFEERNTIM